MKTVHISKEVFPGNISIFLASLVRKGFFVPCWNIQVGASFLQPHEVVNSTFAWSEFHIQHLLLMLFAKGIKSYFDHKDLGGEREWGEGGGTTKVRE